MTEYQVEVAEPAEVEMDNAFYHLLLRSPQAADQLRDGFAEAIRSLSQMPGRCGLAPENGKLDQPIRQLLYRHGRTTYRILFVTFDAVQGGPEDNAPALVRVIRVLHGAQQRLWQDTDQSDEE